MVLINAFSVHVLFYVLDEKNGGVKNGLDVANELSQSLSTTKNGYGVNIVHIQTYGDAP